MRIALCCVRQRPLDILGNERNIISSIEFAIGAGADLWIGSDYELLGYWPQPNPIPAYINGRIEAAIQRIALASADKIKVVIKAPANGSRNAFYSFSNSRYLVSDEYEDDCLVIDQLPKSILHDPDCTVQVGIGFATSILGTDGGSLVFKGFPRVYKDGKLLISGTKYCLQPYDVILFDSEHLIESIKINQYPELAVMITSWMFHILHQSGLKGFFIALSGGIDSGLCAVLVKILVDRIKTETHQNLEMKEFLKTAYLNGPASSENSRIMSRKVADYVSRYFCN